MNTYRADPHKWRDAWERARRTLTVGVILAGLQGGFEAIAVKLGMIEWTQAYAASLWTAFVGAFVTAAGSYILRVWRQPAVPNPGKPS